MITVYSLRSGRVVVTELMRGDMPPPDAVWIDLLSPEDNDRIFISTALGIDLPNEKDMRAIEASSRLYTESGTVYMTTDVLVGFDTPDPDLDVLLVAYAPHAVVTVRYCTPRSLDIFAQRIKNQSELIGTVQDCLMGMLDSITDRTADIIEGLGKQVDDVSHRVFRVPESPNVRAGEQSLNAIVRAIGRAGDSTHKIRNCVNSMTRLVTFLEAHKGEGFTAEHMVRFRALEGDLRSLSEHAQFMAHETTFLLDATLGQINIEQNNIIKIFSVVAVVFLPPTLIASMWGMNFHHMPELDWAYGYPMALILMVISAILPILFFKRRGWM